MKNKKILSQKTKFILEHSIVDNPNIAIILADQCNEKINFSQVVVSKADQTHNNAPD